MSKVSIPELQKAYAVLGVSFSATSMEIEQAYKRQLTREVNGESREMLNHAYLLIASAPLRDFARREKPLSEIEGGPLVAVDTEDIRPGKPDGVEYTIRFVCGALLGCLLSGRMWLNYALQPKLHPLSSVVASTIPFAVIFGFAAAIWGDRFWYSFVGSRWFYWRNR